MQDVDIILASGSPRRRQLLIDLGLAFRVVTADIDEMSEPDEPPIDLAERLAGEKATAVRRTLDATDKPGYIIAADTVVAQGDVIYGKPQDDADAERMLTRLRDDWHQVHSAVSVLESHSGRVRNVVNTTQVLMRAYSQAEIIDYIRTGDPLDKAGAYAIQHDGFAPVREIDGCLTGVMGLPLTDVCRLLTDFGLQFDCSVVAVCERNARFPCCQRSQRRIV